MKRPITRLALGIATVLALGTFSVASAAPAGGTIEGTVSFARGNAHLLVYVVKAPGDFKAPKKDPVMNQLKMHFRPHVMAVLEGSTVDFLNSDSINHNVFSPDHEGYNLGSWGHGEKRSYTFKKLGVYTQLCSLHPEMEGFIVVLQNPYYAFTDGHGHYTIKGVPPGHYQLEVWGEKLHSKDRKRTFTVDVKGPKTARDISL